MKIVLKDNSLEENIEKVKVHIGFGPSSKHWIKQYQELMNHGFEHEVETNYLFKQSFNVKLPTGGIINIPDYLVEQVIDDIRAQKSR